MWKIFCNYLPLNDILNFAFDALKVISHKRIWSKIQKIDMNKKLMRMTMSKHTFYLVLSKNDTLNVTTFQWHIININTAMY